MLFYIFFTKIENILMKFLTFNVKKDILYENSLPIRLKLIKIGGFKMKKLILLGFLSTLFLTTACARSESMFDKVPFLKNIVQNEKNGQAVEEPIVENQIEEKNDDMNSQSKQEITLDDIFFNQIKEVNGQKIILNPDNTMALVNKQFGLPETFLPNDLVRPKVSFSFGNQKIDKSLMRKEAALALEKMFKEAKRSGIELFAVSGYRSYDYQQSLFHAEVDKVGLDKAVEAVAVPGQSEHQTGLAMDISSRGENMLLTAEFGNSKEGKWLTENAHRFGFILRYPKGKESITGYQYEAWHFRYIGINAATIIHENNWTLEEYFQIVKKV
jgi:zinc D-Ala-D-Ala carboxypeptidase